MQARNIWTAGTALLLTTAAHAQTAVYRLNPGSLHEQRSCVAPFSQAWALKGTYRLAAKEVAEDSTKVYSVSDISWTNGIDKEEITGSGLLSVRFLDAPEQLLELDLNIGGKIVHVSGGAHGIESDPLRLVIQLTSQEDPVCYSTLVVVDASIAPTDDCTADFDNDQEVGTDKDIEAFFACLAGDCCKACADADFDRDGDIGTDADIESFFRVLAGGPC
jgi:hypothetical protein